LFYYLKQKRIFKYYKKISSESEKRILEFGRQWETRRIPLLEEYRKLKEDESKRKELAKEKLEKVTAMKQQLKDMVNEIKEKDELLGQMEEEIKNLPKIQRTSYTRKIMDVVKNVRKQKVDIDKILLDIRNLNKEINLISETLERSYHACDELVFKEAKKGDPQVKQAYKNIVAIHGSFEALSTAVKDNGQVTNQIRELEIKIEQISTKKIEQNLEKIMADLKEVKEENIELMTKKKVKTYPKSYQLFLNFFLDIKI